MPWVRRPAPDLAGLLYDLAAHYFWVWVAAVGLALLAGLLSFAIREDRKPLGALAPAS